MRPDPRLIEPPRVVIFDCDGVLVDSERLSVAVEVEILGELGWTITPDEVVERFLGVSDDDYVAEIERVLGRPLPEGWLEAMEPRYRTAFDRSLAAVPGIEQTLDELEAAGVTTCVASSGSHEKMRHTLGLCALYERFEGRIFSATEVPRGKPAPDLFLRAAAEMGAEPHQCAVVEDSPPGVQAGLAAKMRTVAYASGLVPIERLAGDGVEIVTDMRMLAVTLLKGSGTSSRDTA